MISHFDNLSDHLAKKAKEAAQRVRERERGRENENAMSIRFLERFEAMVESYAVTTPYDLEITTYKLNDRGPNTPESRFGADYVIGYTVQLPDFNMGQGVMIQAKKCDNDEVPDLDDLRPQCRDMLEWSADSFVKIYSSRVYRHFPALQVGMTGGDEPIYNGNELSFTQAYNSRSTLEFYRQFFEGFIGDNWIYENLGFLTNPNSNSPVERPMRSDGGASEENNGGVKAVVIAITQPGVEPELPFPRDYATDSLQPENQSEMGEFL